MLKKYFIRPTLVEERTMQRTLTAHHNKLRRAAPAIDCLPPPIYTHLTVKWKKLQLEKERIWRIEDENRRLYCRLAEIMRRRERFPMAHKKLSAEQFMANRKEPRTSTAKSAQGSEQINQTREDNDIWQIPVRSRPHTVAAVRVQNDSLDMKKTCVNTKLLCGCKSRQPAPESKRLAASPLNDVNDLLCGIQSVEITVKQNSKNDLTS